MARFHDKVAVVIGGGSGIGLASAKAFAEEGAQVVITGTRVDKLESAKQEIGRGCVAYSADVTDPGKIAACYAEISRQFGRIDVLFANAGVLSIIPLQSVTEAAWDRVINVNLKGAFFSVQHAVPLMPRGSAIVMTGSTAGQQAVPIASVYAASKAGLRSLARSFAADLISRGIRVNVVSPAAVHTPIFERAEGLTREELVTILKSETDSIPMKRMGLPSEVAAAVLFLASDAAAFITGVDLLVDGGAASL